MHRGYTSRRIAEAMRVPRPIETPDSDAATIYTQRWRRRDGSSHRNFDVLALDDQMAEEMGGIRLCEHYDQHVMDWELVINRPCERSTSHLYIVLGAEHPEETKLRHETFLDRQAGASV